MTLRQFEYFAAIAERLKITAAAQELGVSQSTLSQQVSELERVIGALLLVRQPGGVSLTNAGKAFANRAQHVLSYANHAIAATRAAAGIGRRHVVVGTLLTLSQQLLPPVIRAWAKAHEQIEITIRSYRNHRLLAAAVSAGEVNVAIGPRPDIWSGDLISLGWEEFVVITAENDHSIADPVPIADLSARRWVHYEGSDNGLDMLLDAVCARAGFRPDVAIRGPHTEAAITYAAAGIAIAMMPAGAVPPGAPVRVIRPLPAVRREIAVYSAADSATRCPCTRKLIECLTRDISRLPNG